MVATGALASAIRERLGTRTPGSVLELEATADGDRRMRVEEVYAALDDAAKVAGDPALGFRLGAQLRPGVFRSVEFAIRAAADGFEALETLARYYRIVSDRTSLSFERQIGRPRIVLHPALDPESSRVATECLASVILVRTRSFFEGVEAVREIAFAHSAPDDIGPYVAIAGPEVAIRFGAECTSIVFSPEVLAQPLPTADPDVHAFAATLANELLRRLPGERPLEDRLRDILREPNRELPTLEEAARLLGTSTRTLQRRLTTIGSSYAAEVDAIRRVRAVAMLEETGATCDQVARRLGFLSAGSLTRAFRRWYGTTPTQYASKHRPSSRPPAAAAN
jgi:AraC-like DNA-binding protein